MDKKMKEVMGSEKAMERKVEAAMEQMKILDLDFGGECNERLPLQSFYLKEKYYFIFILTYSTFEVFLINKPVIIALHTHIFSKMPILEYIRWMKRCETFAT